MACTKYSSKYNPNEENNGSELSKMWWNKLYIIVSQDANFEKYVNTYVSIFETIIKHVIDIYEVSQATIYSWQRYHVEEYNTVFVLHAYGIIFEDCVEPWEAVR